MRKDWLSAKTSKVAYEKVNPVVSVEQILRAQEAVREVYMDEKIEKYILDIIFATRYPEKYKLESRFETTHQFWIVAAWKYQPCQCRKMLCIHQASWLCDSRRCPCRCARCFAPQDRHHL